MLKKILSILLISLIMMSTTSLAEYSWDEMTDDEIKAALQEGKEELNSRKETSISVDENNRVLVDWNGITITINGDIKLKKRLFDSCDLTIPVSITNTNTKGCISFVYTYINGLGDDSPEAMIILSDDEHEKQYDINIYNVNEKFKLTSLNDMKTMEFNIMTGIMGNDDTTADVTSETVKTLIFE